MTDEIQLLRVVFADAPEPSADLTERVVRACASDNTTRRSIGRHSPSKWAVDVAAVAAVACAIAVAVTVLSGAGPLRPVHVKPPPAFRPGAWHLEPTAPPPANGSPEIFTNVSCASPRFCVAVGYVGDESVPDAEVWRGRAWQAMTTPPLSSAFGAGAMGGLSDVSCATAAMCVAVGSYRTPTLDPRDAALLETWNGHAWTVTQPSFADPGSVLQSVSCPSVRFCLAVGGGKTALVEDWDGGAWRPWPVTPQVQSATLEEVSCAGSDLAGSGTSQRGGNDCVILGTQPDGKIQNQITYRWSGNIGSLQIAPDPRLVFVQGLSCRSQDWCFAVGLGFTGEPRHLGPFLEFWNGNDWRVESMGGTGVVPVAGAIACWSRSGCVAVGRTAGQPDDLQLRVDQWDGNRWRTAKLWADPSGKVWNLNGVSCTAAEFCTAVGMVENSSGQAGTLAAAN